MQQADAYFMNFAQVARTRANCLRRNVGAVLVKDNHLIATGYNGTSRGVLNCTEGGCTRCFRTDEYQPGEAYDLCVCVHGEENTLLQAARFGSATEGTIMYTTLQPCLSCLKSAINAGVSGIIYADKFVIPIQQRDDYNRMTRVLSVFKEYVAPEVEETGVRHKITTQN